MTQVKHRWYHFWIKSSRGTDSETYLLLPHRLCEEDVKQELEDWCSQFGAWEASENFIRYGFNKVRQPPTKWRKAHALK